MDISVGDRVEMKKQHPCGCKTFEILRVGMDFKIKCEKCGREVMAPRAKIEKNIKKILNFYDYLHHFRDANNLHLDYTTEI